MQYNLIEDSVLGRSYAWEFFFVQIHRCLMYFQDEGHETKQFGLIYSPRPNVYTNVYTI